MVPRTETPQEGETLHGNDLLDDFFGHTTSTTASTATQANQAPPNDNNGSGPFCEITLLDSVRDFMTIACNSVRSFRSFSFFSKGGPSFSDVTGEFFSDYFHSESGHHRFVGGFTITSTLALVIGCSVGGALVGSPLFGVGTVGGALIGAFLGVILALTGGSFTAFHMGEAIAMCLPHQKDQSHLSM